jgi:repressor LexA
MTPKQKKVLQFISTFTERMGYQPSQAEIAQGCGFESLGTVQHYLRVLERDGHISRQWNAKRGVLLTGLEGNALEAKSEANPPCPPFAKGGTLRAPSQRVSAAAASGAALSAASGAALSAASAASGAALSAASGAALSAASAASAAAAATIAVHELPLVGIVAAGRPVEAFQLSDAIEVPSSMAGAGNVVYEVRGDSMVEMGIMDGDFVAVHPQAVAESGQTVIAEVNGSITIKKYLKKGNYIELRPANSMMQPIIVTENDEFHIRGVLVGSMRFYRKWSVKSST